MRIHDIMSSKVVTIAPGDNVAAARELLRRNGIRHLVVTTKKRILGVLSDRDLAGQADEKPVADVMTHDVTTIEPSATLREAAAVMSGHTVDCLPVVDGEELTGIVTTTDLLRALAKGAHPAPPPERFILRKRGPRKRRLMI